jgi:hypothetical protein
MEIDMDNNWQRGQYSLRLLGATERAMRLAAANAHEDLKRGLNTVGTITCVAPLAGFLGTIWALMVNTFLGIAGERSSIMGALAERISWAVVPTALGILVGLQAFWIHRYLGGRLEEYDGEIEAGAFGLLACLAPHVGRRSFSTPIVESGDSLTYLETYSRDSETQSGFRRFGTLITTILLLIEFAVRMAVQYMAVEFYGIALSRLIVTNLFSVMMMFGFVCLPVYAVWVDFLHRKPGGVVGPIAAVLSLAWYVAGLI